MSVLSQEKVEDYKEKQIFGMPSSFTWRHYLLKKVCIVLGVYEFISAYNFYYNPKYSLHHIPNEFKYPTGNSFSSLLISYPMVTH